MTGIHQRFGSAPGRWMAALVVSLGLGLRAESATKALAERFAGASPKTLIGRLDAAAEPAAWPAGVEVTFTTQPVGELGGVLLEGVLVNRGAAALRPDPLPILRLSFRLGRPSQDRAFEPLAYRTEQWYGSTFWSGPDWTRVGKDWHHPGENTPSSRCFVTPRAGRVHLSGRVYKLHLEGDGIRAMILHGDRQLWQAEIEGKDGTGVEPSLDLEVRAGERLRFVVHKRGAIACDTTHWDPVVTYSDGTAFQASASFGPVAGKDGWFYEMATGEAPAVRSPLLVALGQDLAPRLVTIQPERAVAVEARDCLPFLLLEDGAETSGVALAMDPTAGWRLEVARPDTLSCHLTLSAAAMPLEPGATRPLPKVLIMPYDGRWSAGQTRLAAALNADSAGLAELRRALAAAAAEVTRGMLRQPEPTLLLMTVAEWYAEDAIQDTPESYAAALTTQLARAQALLGDVPAAIASGAHARLDDLAAQTAKAGRPLEQCRPLYLHLRTVKRDLALAAAEIGPQPVLICKRRPPNYSHLVMQYYGWRQQPGGGLYVLEEPGVSLRTRDLTRGKLPPGNCLEPRLSYDATRIVFSHVAVPETPINPASLTVNEAGPDEAYFHVYTLGVDGANLRQITAGTYDDVMPTWLPDGGIAFCSTRRRAYSRCFGGQFSKRWDSYTLQRMAADGSNLQQLSWNDVNEWFPEVSNAGNLVFARWDYIDRDAVTHQNLWSMRPDGTNQMAIWGNATANPHCAFQAKAIPDSGKLVFVASAHHSATGGPLCLLDPAVDSNSSHDAITRLTPQRFPESEGSIEDYYNSPWPLSERRFLVAYSPERLRFEPAAQPDNALGVYLLDAAGNRELLYRDPLISSTSPTLLRARPVPPVLASVLPPEAEATAELVLTDVYRGLGDLPRGTIRELRIIQILPKTTPISNTPPIGFAGEENTRAVLGTVPVEPDGSARFLVPSGKALLFQALDEHGYAYQTMRSTTALQAGEKTSCSGCHENRMSVPSVARPLAQARPPSTLRVGPFDGRPFSYMSVVQPVWDKHCLSCHGAKPSKNSLNLTATARGGFAESYWSLCGDPQAFWGAKTNPENAAKALVPRFGARNRIEVTPPGGLYGARGSRLLKLLRAGHENVSLAAEDMRRIATWIDCNAVFYGSYFPEVQAQELLGQAPPMPEIQ